MTRGMLQLLLAAGIAGTCMVADSSAQSLPLSGEWTGTAIASGSGEERLNLVFALGNGQNAGGMDPAAAVSQGFAEVSGWLLKAADMVPAEKYTYRPAPTVRTFGELLGHVVDGYKYFCGRASGQPVEWSDATAQGKTDKAVIVAALKSATDACTAAHKGAGAGVPPLISNYGHTSLHYGNVVTYMRMLGLVPPSS